MLFEVEKRYFMLNNPIITKPVLFEARANSDPDKERLN